MLKGNDKEANSWWLGLRMELCKGSQLLLLSVALLIALGLVMVLSSSLGHDWTSGSPAATFFRQMRGLALGSIAFVIASSVHPRVWVKWAPYLLAISAAILLLTLFAGVKVGGARRWLQIPIFGRFQPSEIAKIAIPLFAAWSLTRYFRFYSILRGEADDPSEAEQTKANKLTTMNAYFFKKFIFVIAVSMLVVLAPDYGTGALLLGMSALLFGLAGLDWGTLARLALLAVFPGSVLLYIRWEEMLERFSGIFVVAWLFGLDISYQLQEGLVAVVGGGWFGVGLGNGLQKNNIPAQHNDFVVAVISEELGAIGILILISLYTLFLWGGWQALRACKDPALRLLGIGILLIISLQAWINMAVVLAVGPTKGIALPFVSTGSSGLLIVLFEVGVLVALSRVDSDPVSNSKQSSLDSQSPAHPAPLGLAGIQKAQPKTQGMGG